MITVYITKASIIHGRMPNQWWSLIMICF